MRVRPDESDRSRRAERALLLAIALLTLIYVACVLILEGDVVLPLG